MGCVTSSHSASVYASGPLSSAESNASAKKPSLASGPASLATAKKPPLATSDKFRGVRPGMPVLFLDSFTSKHSGASLNKWRSATVRVFDGYNKTSKLQLRFTGFSSKYDRWIDLNRMEELEALSPESLLSPEQIENGEPLDDYQRHVALEFLDSGELPPVDGQDVMHMTASSNKGGGGKPTGGPAVVAFPLPLTDGVEDSPAYTIGQKVDVQDVLFRGDGNLKWRIAQITDIAGGKVRLHFTDLGAAPWDEVIDLSKEGQRIKPAGSMSGLQRHSVLRKAHSNSNTSRRRTFDSDLPKPTTSIAATSNSATAHDSIDPEDLAETSELDNCPPKLLAVVSPQQLLQNRQAQPSPTSSGQRSPAPAFASFASDQRHSQGIPMLGRTHRRHSSSGLESGHEFLSRKKSMETSFCDRMEARGLHVVDIDPDGNCLFRAVAHQLYLDPERHLELRRACVEHMAAHKERFQVFCTSNFDHHLRRMAIEGTWAAELEIRALEEICDRVFSIYSSDSLELRPAPMNTNFDERRLLGMDVETLNLSYHGNHYNSVFDQRHALPLAPRPGTRLLQKARQRLFSEGK